MVLPAKTQVERLQFIAGLLGTCQCFCSRRSCQLIVTPLQGDARPQPVSCHLPDARCTKLALVVAQRKRLNVFIGKVGQQLGGHFLTGHTRILVVSQRQGMVNVRHRTEILASHVITEGTQAKQFVAQGSHLFSRSCAFKIVQAVEHQIDTAHDVVDGIVDFHRHCIFARGSRCDQLSKLGHIDSRHTQVSDVISHLPPSHAGSIKGAQGLVSSIKAVFSFCDISREIAR